MPSGSQPSVSVIIPVFNGARYIRDAVESALDQTFKDLEIIVVDDGSTDDTKILIEDLVSGGKIQYIYHENRGLSAARNTGINSAKSRYIKFLDSDDFLYPDQIRQQFEQIKTSDNIFSISDFCFLRPNDEVVKLKYHPVDKERQLASFMDINSAPVHAFLVPKALIQKAGGFDESLKACEDWDLWIRVLKEGAIIKHLPYMGCCYRISLNSMSADMRKMLMQKCKLFEKVNGWLLKEKNLSRQAEKIYWFDAVSKTNSRLFEECIARGVPFESVLKNAIQLMSVLYRSRLKGGSKQIHALLGTRNYIRMKYFFNILAKKDYKFNVLNKDLIWKLGDAN